MPGMRGHVGLNAQLLSGQAGYRSAGIHGYIYHLLHHLPQADPTFRYTVFTGRGRPVPSGGPGRQATLTVRATRWPTERPLVRILWEQVAQPWALRQARVDLLHALAFVAPLWSPCPTVVTVHDLSFLRFPERFRPANRLYLTWMTRLSARRARRIIAVSHYTRTEVVRLLGFPEERVDVVVHGVDHTRFHPYPPAQVAAFRQARGLPDRFILFVGTLEPRKNLPTLLRAFARLREQHPEEEVTLVIAGGKGWYYDPLFAQVRALGLSDRVRFPGFVPDAELPLWYSAATFFVYPSLYEGFGMPLLEAMACGTPVIAARSSALPEVVGEAGLLVPPDDAEGLARAMAWLLKDEALRLHLRERGRAQAARFTWAQTASQTVVVYRRALQDG